VPADDLDASNGAVGTVEQLAIGRDGTLTQTGLVSTRGGVADDSMAVSQSHPRRARGPGPAKTSAPEPAASELVASGGRATDVGC
jgi:hypothetical protein